MCDATLSALRSEIIIFREMSILDLPPELFIRILVLLDYRDVLRCCSVCKGFNTTICTSQKLKYKIELGFDGMIDFPTNSAVSMTTGEKLQLLLDRRESWKRLAWKRKLQVQMSGSCKAYELVSGVFGKSIGANSSSLGSCHFVLARLPTRWDDGDVIVRQDVGVATRDFVIDPTQDLIGYVSENGIYPHSEIVIHLRTISSNKSHPAARQPTIHHICRLPFVMTHSFVAVADDVIAIFFWVDSPGLIIWNWRTSDMLVYVTDHERERLPQGIWDFSFLSNRAFILTSRAGNGSIEIYSFENTPVPIHIASLQLPTLQPDVDLALFSTHSGPFTTLPSNAYPEAPLGEHKPFTNAPESRIHAMCVQYNAGTYNLDRSRYFLFIKNQSLLRFVEEYKKQVNMMELDKRLCGKKVPWDEWGLDESRFMSFASQFRWLRYVHGLKVVCPSYNMMYESDVGHCFLEVFDFNVHLKRLPESTKTMYSSADAYTVHTEPTIIPRAGIFNEDVESWLPYTSAVKRNMEVLYSGFMIDEERLVGLTSRSSREGEMGNIDVFTF